MGYCIDCRYLKRAKGNGLWCFIPTGNYITGKIYKIVYRENDPTLKNQNERCTEYKKKWYKFFT